MIELCGIFSLDSPVKQQDLFVRQPFNLSSFRAISVPAIFYGSRSDSFKFSVSLSARRVAEVCSHSFQIKIVCFERLLNLSIQFLLMCDKILSIDRPRNGLDSSA